MISPLTVPHPLVHLPSVDAESLGQHRDKRRRPVRVPLEFGLKKASLLVIHSLSVARLLFEFDAGWRFFVLSKSPLLERILAQRDKRLNGV